MRPLAITLPAAILSTALLLAGCTMPYRPPQFLEPDATFPGLIDFAARAPAKTADVLLVHGMCTHDASWAADTVGTLAAQLSANVTPAPPQQPRATPAVDVIPHEVTTPQGTLRFKSLIWSPLTTPLKQQLCYDQTDKSPICTGAPPFTATRPKLNARIKDWLMDDCLPDALVYQGVARDQIQDSMRAAIMQAMRDADEDAPLVVVAESLGSKILFDTLLRMSEEEDSRAARMAERQMQRLAWLVMAANQLPLLHMADQPLPDATALSVQAGPPDSLQRLLLKRRAPDASRRAPAPMTVVAFSDPGDLLSYTLLPERYRDQNVGVVNVLVSNARTYVGWFENPVDAHVDYLSNPDVGALVGCGRPRSALCR